MKRSSWLVRISTLGSIGNLKGAGTVATVVTLPLVYVCSFLELSHALIAVLVLCLLSLFIVGRAVAAFPGEHDPASIVLDEVAGCLVTFVGIPWRFELILLGFVLFRILDIFKPLGVRQVEYCISPWGIVLDDIMAGLITNVVLHIVVWLIS